VSNSNLFLEGLRKILGCESSIEIVAEASSLKAVMGCLDQTKPEFVFLDNTNFSLDTNEIYNLLNLINKEKLEIKVILFGAQTTNQDKLTFPDVIYTSKRTNISDLVSIIKNSNKSAQAKETNPKSNVLDEITGKVTKMETKVLGLISKGLSNKEIADKLLISERTVKCHLANIFRKLGFQRRYQLMVHERYLKYRIK
jgi:NarL family two-component system response regulator LiaR